MSTALVSVRETADVRPAPEAGEAFTDEDCIHWLWKQHHSQDGKHAQCPSCMRLRRFHPVRKRGSFSCDTCGHHIFPRVGTMFERSRVPLRDWFTVIYELKQDPEITVDRLAVKVGTTVTRAKRVHERLQQAKGAGEAAEIARIAEVVGTWDQQWQVQVRGKSAHRGETDLTRIKILNATVQVIVSRGYSEVRVSDVAAEAGVSTATVHYHFETKYELLFAALSNAMREWFDSDTGEPSPDPIVNLGRSLRQAIVTSPDRTEQIVWMDFSRLALRDSRWAAKLEELCLQWDARLRTIIQHGVDEGVFVCVGSVDDAVMRIQGLIDGLAERVMLAYSDSPPDRVQRLVAEAAAIELGIDKDELLRVVQEPDEA